MVELLVGMAVMVIILAAIAGSLTAVVKAYQFNMAQSRNVASTREVLNAISNELRYASYISIDSGASATIPNATITYTVASENRTMYATVGNPASTYNLVITHGATTLPSISIGNLKAITLSRNTKLLDIKAEENNASYSDSPTMTSTTTLTLPNL